MSPGANAAPATVVDVHASPASIGGSSRRLSAAWASRDDRPRVRVRCRFAGEVAGVEFLEGGVDVVEVEHDDCHDPFVGVDLDDVRASRCTRRLRPVTIDRTPIEDEALPAGRNDGRRDMS